MFIWSPFLFHSSKQRLWGNLILNVKLPTVDCIFNMVCIFFPCLLWQNNYYKTNPSETLISPPQLCMVHVCFHSVTVHSSVAFQYWILYDQQTTDKSMPTRLSHNSLYIPTWYIFTEWYIHKNFDQGLYNNLVEWFILVISTYNMYQQRKKSKQRTVKNPQTIKCADISDR